MGATLGTLSFSVDSADHEAVHVEDMGDGSIILSSLNHLGATESVVVSYAQLSAISGTFDPCIALCRDGGGTMGLR